jgi:hypothetical protein
VTDAATLVSAAHLIAALIGILVARGRSNSIRIVVEVALLLILGSHLLQHGADPLPVGTIPSAAAEGAWLRAIAVVWWLIGARLFSTVVVLALGRDSKSRHASLVSDLLAGAIYLAALTFILNSVFGIPIKGLLATSSVIPIVLGLALQNTLSDVFSGIATGIERPFGIGQHVSIGDHAEGIVIEMNCAPYVFRPTAEISPRSPTASWLAAASSTTAFLPKGDRRLSKYRRHHRHGRRSSWNWRDRRRCYAWTYCPIPHPRYP